MNCILTNELHIDEWTSPFANGLDQLTNYRKFAPRLEQEIRKSILANRHAPGLFLAEPTLVLGGSGKMQGFSGAARKTWMLKQKRESYRMFCP